MNIIHKFLCWIGKHYWIGELRGVEIWCCRYCGATYKTLAWPPPPPKHE